MVQFKNDYCTVIAADKNQFEISKSSYETLELVNDDILIIVKLYLTLRWPLLKLILFLFLQNYEVIILFWIINALVTSKMNL